MSRAVAAAAGLVLVAAWSGGCSHDWEELRYPGASAAGGGGTTSSGTGGTTTGSTTSAGASSHTGGSGGSGGGGSCYGCFAYVSQCEQQGECPTDAPFCSVDAQVRFEELADCACNSCEPLCDIDCQDWTNLTTECEDCLYQSVSVDGLCSLEFHIGTLL